MEIQYEFEGSTHVYALDFDAGNDGVTVGELCNWIQDHVARAKHSVGGVYNMGDALCYTSYIRYRAEDGEIEIDTPVRSLRDRDFVIGVARR